MRSETREQRRRRQRMAAAVRMAVMLAVLALLGFGCSSAVAVALEREQPVWGEDYLAAAGADNAARAAAAEQWAAWRGARP